MFHVLAQNDWLAHGRETDAKTATNDATWSPSFRKAAFLVRAVTLLLHHHAIYLRFSTLFATHDYKKNYSYGFIIFQ